MRILLANTRHEQQQVPVLASKFNKYYAEEFVNGFPSFGCVDEDGDRRRIWRQGALRASHLHVDELMS
jgi:hypothetical protein